jgi:Tol biopolymer transport system component
MRRTAACAVVVSTALALLITQPASATFPGRNGLIAVGGYGFSFSCRPQLTLHVVRSDGSGLRPFTASGACGPDRYEPDWTADGGRMAFFSAHRVGLMSAHGSRVRRAPVPKDACCGGDPQLSVSPDGARVAFSGPDQAHDENDQIWMAAFDGSPTRRLRAGSSVRWSPDGRRLAYVTSSGALGLLDAQTQQPLSVRRFSRDILSLDWSPDGRRLLLVMWSKPETANSWLATLAVNQPTSHPRRLPVPHLFRTRLDPVAAVWSPDGRRIAVIADRHVGGGAVRASLWLMRSRGGRATLLASGGYTDDIVPDGVSWQPVP